MSLRVSEIQHTFLNARKYDFRMSHHTKMIFVDSCLALKQRPVPHPHTSKFSGKLITDDG
jgi:hypothetical protein